MLFSEYIADKMVVTAQVFGMGILFSATAVFLTNIFIIGLFLSRKLISVQHDCAVIYRLIFNFIICDTIQITPTIYIGLCSLLQVNYFSAKVLYYCSQIDFL